MKKSALIATIAFSTILIALPTLAESEVKKITLNQLFDRFTLGSDKGNSESHALTERYAFTNEDHKTVEKFAITYHPEDNAFSLPSLQDLKNFTITHFEVNTGDRGKWRLQKGQRIGFLFFPKNPDTFKKPLTESFYLKESSGLTTCYIPEENELIVFSNMVQVELTKHVGEDSITGMLFTSNLKTDRK